MNVKEIGINRRNSVDSTQDRDYCRVLVNAALNLQVPQAIYLVIYILNITLVTCTYELFCRKFCNGIIFIKHSIQIPTHKTEH